MADHYGSYTFGNIQFRKMFRNFLSLVHSSELVLQEALLLTLTCYVNISTDFVA
jgi:hypothetical protein